MESGWQRTLRTGNTRSYSVKKTKYELPTIATGACASKKNGGLHAEDPQRVMTGDSTNACASVSIQNTPGNTKGHRTTPLPTL